MDQGHYHIASISELFFMWLLKYLVWNQLCVDAGLMDDFPIYIDKTARQPDDDTGIFVK